MTINDELVYSAASLARHAPAEWQRFISALGSYTNEQMSNCVASALDELPRAQGRAQQAALFCNLMVNALSNADKQERRK